MIRYLKWLLSHRVLVLTALLISIGLAGWSAARIQIRFALRDFYDYPGNPDVPVVDKYHHDFGDPGGYVTVLIQADDVFRHDLLVWIADVTLDLEPIPIFSHVRSLVNAKAISGDGDTVTVGPLLQPLPSDQASIERARKIAISSELLRRRLVSADSKTTAILVEMRVPVAQATIPEQQEALDAVSQVLARHPTPKDVIIHVAGAPAIEVEGSRLLMLDQLVFFPVAVLIMLTALFITFRSLHGIVLPFASVIAALAWTFGIFPLFGRPIDMLSSCIPAALLVYGAVDPIFVLTRFLQKLELGKTREEAVLEAYRELGMPCFLTSFTTALGFFCFATLKLPTLRVFGLVVGIGVCFAWVTTMVVLPLLLASLPPPKKKLESLGVTQWLDARIVALWGWLQPRCKMVVIASFALLALGAFAGRNQTISASHVGMLPPGEVRSAIALMEQKLTGVLRTAIVIDGPPGSMKRPDVLRAIARIDDVARKNKLVESTISLASLIAEENQAFNGGDINERKIPDSQMLISQYLSILDPDSRGDFVDADYSRTHIRILSEDGGSHTWRPLAVELNRAMDRELTPLGVHGQITGFAGVIVPVLDSMVWEMIVGFMVGFGIIVLVIFVLFRDWRIALISVLPNFLPAVACFVVISILGIPLRVGTTLFLSVSIGGLFNTTIHIAARARQRLDEGETDPDAVMLHALRKVGPPAFYTAIILSVGFSVFILSRFPDLLAFGVCSMTVLLAGFFSDMVVTAALMRLFYNWKRAPQVATNPLPAAVAAP